MGNWPTTARRWRRLAANGIGLETRLVEERAGAEKAERAVELTRQANEASSRYLVYRRAAELRAQMTSSRRAIQRRSRSTDCAPRSTTCAARSSDSPRCAPNWRPSPTCPATTWRSQRCAGGRGRSAGRSCSSSPCWRSAAARCNGLTSGGVVRRSSSRRLARRDCLSRLASGGEINDVRLQNELRESEIARRLQGRTELAEKVRETEQERAAKLVPLGVEDVPAAEAVLAAEAEHVGADRYAHRRVPGPDGRRAGCPEHRRVARPRGG